MACQHAGNRPDLVAVERQHRPDADMIPSNPAQRGEPCDLLARVDQIEHRKRKILRVRRQPAGAALAGRFDAARFGGAARQFAQQRQLALADHALGIVGIGAEDSAGRAVRVRNRTVGEGVIGFFRKAVALHDQELGFDVGAFPFFHRPGEQRRDVLPDFVPHHPGRAAERPWMLAADDRLVGIVVEIDQLIAPADPDRLLRGEHDANGRLQALRPTIGRADRRAGPVKIPDQPGEFATADEQALALFADRLNRIFQTGHNIPIISNRRR